MLGCARRGLPAPARQPHGSRVGVALRNGTGHRACTRRVLGGVSSNVGVKRRGSDHCGCGQGHVYGSGDPTSTWMSDAVAAASSPAVRRAGLPSLRMETSTHCVLSHAVHLFDRDTLERLLLPHRGNICDEESISNRSRTPQITLVFPSNFQNCKSTLVFLLFYLKLVTLRN